MFIPPLCTLLQKLQAGAASMTQLRKKTPHLVRASKESKHCSCGGHCDSYLIFWNYIYIYTFIFKSETIMNVIVHSDYFLGHTGNIRNVWHVLCTHNDQCLVLNDFPSRVRIIRIHVN
ncbi:hypothetical protein Cni_G04037 [Canna indica]|uniref:Uncharacterized protein n=1 Tax=Canna indica TaxID=4628 RepID=A0AAQ3JW52_9LILI|nr:hypothetical protein Cni_G04037 [Canna indica]